jgi:cyclopropane fatty-acyl-phospholipid synthase-like methyltransferase
MMKPRRVADPFSAAAAILSLLMVVVGAALAQGADHYQHRFEHAEKWARIFDDPAREAWQKPQEVIRALALAPDAVIADIGAGTGYFAVRLARSVPQGRVYGVDVAPDMVRYLEDRAKREGLSNLTAQLAAPDDPRIPAAVDLAILVNTYHHIPARERYFRALQKSLKSGGRLAVIDFTLDSPEGPPQRSRIPAETVKRELARAGYALAQEHAFLPYQHFLVFRPASAR